MEWCNAKAQVLVACLIGLIILQLKFGDSASEFVSSLKEEFEKSKYEISQILKLLILVLIVLFIILIYMIKNLDRQRGIRYTENVNLKWEERKKITTRYYLAQLKAS